MRDQVTGADNARTFQIDGRDKFRLYFASDFASGLLLLGFTITMVKTIVFASIIIIIIILSFFPNEV